MGFEVSSALLGLLAVVIGYFLLQAIYRLIERSLITLSKDPAELVSEDKSIPRELLEPTDEDVNTREN